MYNFRTPIVVLDCEMSGLCHETNQLLQVSALKCDPRNLKVLDTFNSFIGPKNGDLDKLEEDSNTKALFHSSYYQNIDKIKTSPSSHSVIKQFFNWLPESYILVGYKLDLDLLFLNQVKEEISTVLGLKFPRISYRHIDLSHMIEFYSSLYHKPADIQSRKLKDVCSSFGLETKEAHDSLNDCHMSLSLLKHLLSITTFTEKPNDQ